MKSKPAADTRSSSFTICACAIDAPCAFAMKRQRHWSVVLVSGIPPGHTLVPRLKMRRSCRSSPCSGASLGSGTGRRLRGRILIGDGFQLLRLAPNTRDYGLRELHGPDLFFARA